MGKKWWEDKNGFFGGFYLEGDNSLEGYQSLPQTLEERTQKEVEGAISILKLKKGQKILDVPCGYGRHAIALAKKGFKVTGVDLNPVHLKKAKNDAKEKGVKVEWKKENMLKLKYKEEFDACINLFYSFGFFDKDSENFKALENIFRSLKKGGKFLFHTDVNLQRVLKGKHKFEEIRHLKSGNKLTIVESYSPENKRMNGSWTILKKDGKKTKKNYSMRVYSKEEFIELCKNTGFKNTAAYGYWSTEPYTEKSEDMIIVAEK